MYNRYLVNLFSILHQWFLVLSVVLKLKLLKSRDTISPNALIDSAPTPAAPMVCTTVPSDKITDKDLSIFDLNNKDFTQLLSTIVVKYVPRIII